MSLKSGHVCIFHLTVIFWLKRECVELHCGGAAAACHLGLSTRHAAGSLQRAPVNGRKEGEWPAELTELSDHCELVVSPLV